MNTFIFSAALLLSLGAGLWGLLLTYRLHTRFRLNHLSTYLYFQIFFNVYGIYGLMGEAILRRILPDRGISVQTVETMAQFFALLGLPFLLLAWYMFLRLCREIADIPLTRRFNLGYLSALIAGFAAYGAMVITVNVARLDAGQFRLLSASGRAVFAAVEILTMVLVLPPLLKNKQTVQKRKAVRMFAAIYFLAFLARITLFFIMGSNSFLALLYLLIFFAGNLPPLLVWKHYLEKHAPAAKAPDIGSRALSTFFEDFKISKREQEVIVQICAGKTNKEISETLFISLQTVKDHIYRIFQKTNVRNRVQLINLLRDYGGSSKPNEG